MLKIILLEDHPIVAYNIMRGLSSQENIAFVHTIYSGNELKNYEGLADIHIVLLDINLPDTDGFEICEFLHTHHPNIKIIGISSFENYEYIARFMAAGAHGYAVKGTNNEELFWGIQQVMKGQNYLCPIARKVYGKDDSQNSKPIKLTKLEQQLAELSSKKLKVQQISKLLDIPEADIAIYLVLLAQKMEKYKITFPLNHEELQLV